MNSFNFNAYYDDEKPQEEKFKPREASNGSFNFNAYYDDDFSKENSNEEPIKEKEGENSILKTAKEYGKSALKGFVKGEHQLRQMIAPFGAEIHNPQAVEKNQEDLSEYLEEKLPTEPGFVSGAIERTAKAIPGNISLPGGKVSSTLGRTAAAGVAGQAAEEIGLGETGQGLAELGAYISPGFAKKLLAKGGNKELIEGARKLGLNDEEIAPLLDPGFTEKWLSKIAKKTGRTEERIKNTKEAVTKAYTNIAESKEAKGVLPYKNAVDTVIESDRLLHKLPTEVASLIKSDYDKLIAGPMTGESLIRFWEAVNFQFPKRGGSRLQSLKEPIGKALAEINPALKKDFDVINELASNQHKISKILKPKDVDKTINLIKSIPHGPGIMASYFLGNIWPLVGSVALKGTATQLATEMATNPRFKQLQLKFIHQLNESKYIAGKHTLKMMSKSLSAEFPDAADMIYELSEQDLKELFGSEE